ncbi:DUF4038 domain-containing protein [Frankia sp. AgB1.9]|uniref:apiosidase-like domain-containing protein n=1 Tax=unclassified Frankia TaxID=2632575 RepID=UPI0019349B5D|nr:MULTISPECIES: DUF4038 domain-containing protein [unclassified Frankia]MBL7486948.1 DUF4038 domain-containing protein [Frankia sp. AgW1.1]MBL7552862.1 DUF4038 domain-containing protein [Frankia sp. AgB1.9]MBL7625366.1 DUF4038 domain-containing protein [Frankia sp. AgB1.8]
MPSSGVPDASRQGVPCFLADTWWFALTGRLSDDRFAELARLRAAQGFTAVQLVVGIPPEVGPGNRNAWSTAGPAWFPDGRPNPGYLDRAREKIQALNAVGLTAVVYGCWGHQLAWLGVPGAQRWWDRLVERLDDLDVLYCVSGETNLWIGTESLLLPDRTTDDLIPAAVRSQLSSRVLARRGSPAARAVLRRLWRSYVRNRYAGAVRTRRAGWDAVLTGLAASTSRPLLAHVMSGETSADALDRDDLLAAVTVQTGHDPASRRLLWEWPARVAERFPGRPFINLEPWYEGILDDFGTDDQLFAYWVSMLSGAAAYCYGAHGMWNVGDGAFLAHWGKQSLDDAAALATPALLGASHRVLREAGWPDAAGTTTVDAAGGTLRSITRSRSGGAGAVTYFPDGSLAGPARTAAGARYFAPDLGEFVAHAAREGPLVVLT